MHYSSKVYGHEQGLSACFRQWRADSHCNKLHGYALSVGLKFQAATLDSRHWVVDFGALKGLKSEIAIMLDHRTIIAIDDPHKDAFLAMEVKGLMDVLLLPEVGCEAFAQHIYQMADGFLRQEYVPSLIQDGIVPPRYLALTSVEVREHGANGAMYAPTIPHAVTDGAGVPIPYGATTR